jgi:phasin
MAQASFEVPAQVREFMEKSVEQARSAFETFAGAAQKAVSSVEPVLPSGAKEVNEKVFGYSQANIEATFDFAKKLAHAKDAQELMQVHSDFVKSQIETLQQQANELSAAVQKAMTGATGKSSELS